MAILGDIHVAPTNSGEASGKSTSLGYLAKSKGTGMPHHIRCLEGIGADILEEASLV